MVVEVAERLLVEEKLLEVAVTVVRVPAAGGLGRFWGTLTMEMQGDMWGN
jgi:hypothetical protein